MKKLFSLITNSYFLVTPFLFFLVSAHTPKHTPSNIANSSNSPQMLIYWRAYIPHSWPSCQARRKPHFSLVGAFGCVKRNCQAQWKKKCCDESGWNQNGTTANGRSDTRDPTTLINIAIVAAYCAAGNGSCPATCSERCSHQTKNLRCAWLWLEQFAQPRCVVCVRPQSQLSRAALRMADIDASSPRQKA